MMERINPNHLTTLRLILTPIVMSLLFHQGFWCLAAGLALMVVCELTDFFDGFAARKYGKISQFGKLYDPACDSLYHLAVFLFLVPLGLSVWVMAAFLIRDIAIMYARLYCLLNGCVLAARWSGKFKAVAQMAFQLIFVINLLAQASPVQITSREMFALCGFRLAAGFIAVFFTVYSLADYLYFVKKEIQGAA